MPADVLAFMDVTDDTKYDNEYIAYVGPLVKKTRWQTAGARRNPGHT